jgi:hypothetical protein
MGVVVPRRALRALSSTITATIVTGVPRLQATQL